MGWLKRALLLFLSLFPFTSNSQAKTISLKQAVEKALLQNTNIKERAYLANEAESEILRAKSIYDLKLSQDITYIYSKKEPPSLILGTKKIDVSATTLLSKTFPFGTTLSLGYKQLWEKTNSTFSTLNPYWDVYFEVKLTQPLLENSFGTLFRKKVASAEDVSQSADALLHFENEKTIYAVETAFFTLARAEQLFFFQEEFFTKAEALYVYQKKQLTRGLIEDADLYASRSYFENRAANLHRAKADLIDAGTKLNLLLQEERIVPYRVAGTPLRFEEKSKSRCQVSLQEKAISKRKDLRATMAELDARERQVSAAKNKRLPSLDFFASLQSTGLDQRYLVTIDKILEVKFPVYTAGAVFTMPFENREAQSETEQAVARRAIAQVQKARLEQEISQNLHSLCAQLEETERATDLAKQAEASALQMVKKREKQFKMGRVPFSFFIEDEERLLSAKQAFLEASYRLKLMESALAFTVSGLAESYFEAGVGKTY